MNRQFVRRTVGPAAAACAVALGIAACSHVSAVRQPLGYMASQNPLEVWVIRRHNDSIYRIAQPRLQGDTLIGFSLPRPGDPVVKYQEIPLQDVRQMRARQSAPVRTAALIAGIGGVAFLAFRELVGGGGNGPKVAPNNFCDCDFDEVCAC